MTSTWTSKEKKKREERDFGDQWPNYLNRAIRTNKMREEYKKIK